VGSKGSGKYISAEVAGSSLMPMCLIQKQKKRLKASNRLEQPIPQQILRMEYMSSEDSSEGEDSGLPEGTWQFYADMTGRASAEEKVVEVKTPHWRSTQVGSSEALSRDDLAHLPLAVARNIRPTRRDSSHADCRI
jgi:hypothetical protein